MNLESSRQAISRLFRAKRMKSFASEFSLGPSSCILDVGGTAFNWELLHVKPQVILFNIPNHRGDGSGALPLVEGDACDMPFEDRSFPLIFSNSTIEHVGTYERQKLFANEIRRVGVEYYVQTPNRWFFMEPHYLTPFIHWLPKSKRRKLVRKLTVWGLLTRPTQSRIDEKLEEIRLVTAAEMRELFPEAEIRREKFLGLTKSFVAVYHLRP